MKRFRGSQRQGEEAPLLLTIPILRRLESVDGFLAVDEADLLIAGVARALSELPPPHTIVEIGSYCGRSTIALASAAKQVSSRAKLYAIDPHEGCIDVVGQTKVSVEPTLKRFRRNIRQAGCADVVELIRKRSWDVSWERPISFLLIDALHDYESVSRDFDHYARWLVPGGYLAFHDYDEVWPGVKRFVDELLVKGEYRQVAFTVSMMLVRRVPSAAAQQSPQDIEEAGIRDSSR